MDMENLLFAIQPTSNKGGGRKKKEKASFNHTAKDFEQNIQ